MFHSKISILCRATFCFIVFQLSKIGHWIWKACVWLVKISAALYVILCIGCACLQRRMIYFPPSVNPAEVEQYAASQNLTRWTDPHGTPIGWKRLSATQPAQAQVLITHGNACCAFECGHFADAVQQVASLDVYIVEYPGYENRPGKPTERGLYAAADEAVELLPTNRPTDLVGESLGTGVAAYLAGKHPTEIAGVVLFAPYNSLVDVGQAHMVILPVGLMLVDRYPSTEHLRTYHGPVAMLTGGHDWVVLEKFGLRLYDSYDGPKRLWEFPKGNHGTVMLQPPEIWKQILNFLQTNQTRT
jgi:pimeloyl-ACP methyl ester carboxylesterase